MQIRGTNHEIQSVFYFGSTNYSFYIHNQQFHSEYNSNGMSLGSRNASIGKDRPEICDIRYSPDGKRLAVVIETGILIFNTQTDSKPEVFVEDIDRPWRVAFSSDGKTLTSVYSFGTIQLRDAKTNGHIRTLNNFPPEESGQIMLSPDGRTIAYRHWNKTVSLWDAKMEQHLPNIYRAFETCQMYCI